jgi:hypothetical protein
MPRRPDARTLLFEKIRTSPAKFVHVVGVPYLVEQPPQEDPALLDALWLTIEVPPYGRLRVVLNTTSRANRAAGADDRVWLGIVAGTWAEKPAPALNEDLGQDYRKIEAAFGVTYQAHDRESLAALLTERAKKAIRAEVWGDLYAQETLGVRQVHCRRESSGVKEDLRNHDGALKLYYAEGNTTEIFLFKFFGQP